MNDRLGYLQWVTINWHSVIQQTFLNSQISAYTYHCEDLSVSVADTSVHANWVDFDDLRQQTLVRRHVLCSVFSFAPSKPGPKGTSKLVFSRTDPLMMYLQFTLVLLPWSCSAENGSKVKARKTKNCVFLIVFIHLNSSHWSNIQEWSVLWSFSSNNAKSYVHHNVLLIVRKFLLRVRRTQVEWNKEFHRNNINDRWRENPSSKKNRLCSDLVQKKPPCAPGAAEWILRGGLMTFFSTLGGLRPFFSWDSAGRKRYFRKIFKCWGGSSPPSPPRFRRLWCALERDLTRETEST